MNDAERARVASIMLDRELDALATGDPTAHTTRAANWAVIEMAYRARLGICVPVTDERRG